jgi:hypothetical protein
VLLAGLVVFAFTTLTPLARPPVPPVPKVSSAITGPGIKYPNPPVNTVPTAVAPRRVDRRGLVPSEYGDAIRNDIQSTAIP